MAEPPHLNEIDQWENGDPLNFAWVKYGDEFQVAKYKAATSVGPILALQQLLLDELFSKLHCGDLVALGHRIIPELSNGPIHIPKHCFAQRPNLKEADGDVIAASGWIYERVRIISPTPDDHLVVHPAIQEFKIPEKRGGGNTGNYENAKIILAELLALAAYQNMAAEPMLDAFNARYIERYSSSHRRTVGVCARSLRTYLKRFRQELANNGNA